MSTFRIQRTRKAPVAMSQKTNLNTWRDIFDSMGKGNWFLVTKPNYRKVSMAANKYVKGNYRLYKHPSRKDCHVFLKKA